MGKIRRDIFASHELKDFWKVENMPKVPLTFFTEFKGQEVKVEGFVRDDNVPLINVAGWAEEDLRDLESKWSYEQQHEFYKIIGEGFMEDD